jgi:hypothetical protein
VGFEFGSGVHYGKTYSNKLEQLSNMFEPCWSLSEPRISARKHCLGKMSVPILWVEKGKISSGVSEHTGRTGAV